MESMQINLTAPTINKKELNVGSIIYKDNSFIIEILDKSYLSLHEGQTIYYERKLYKGHGEYEVISEESTILEIIYGEGMNNSKIRISSPPNMIYTIDEVSYVKNNTILLTFVEEHNVFPQDLKQYNGYTINIFDEHYEFLTSFRSNYLSVPSNNNEAVTLFDCLINIGTKDICGEELCDNKVDLYEYVFIPKNINRNGILISSATFSNCFDSNGNWADNEEDNSSICNLFKKATYVTFKFNPFMYQTNEGIRFYTDGWLSDVLNINEIPKTITNWAGVCDGTNNNVSEIIEADTCIEVLSSYSKTSLVVYDMFYNIELGMSLDSDEINLGTEDIFKETYSDEIIDELIPKTVDMERIKYSPGFIVGSKDTENHFIWYNPDGANSYGREFIYTSGNSFTAGVIYDNNSPEFLFLYEMTPNGELSGLTLSEGGYVKFDYEYGPHFKNGIMPTLYIFENNTHCTYYLSDEKLNLSYNNATSISFYLHFIKRDEIMESERATMNSIYTSGNVYYDTWHINNEARDYTWWNGMNYEGFDFNLDSFKTFHLNNGKKSDLIGFLNFTDNDIYFRKKKVSQSFLRLSFYNSKDPYTQKLLYYSTIFLDSGDLYGKYIKQLQNEDIKKARENNKLKKTGAGKINDNAFIALYPGGARLDTKITVTNEYDYTKSSEGFNLYLFAEDKTFEAENDEKTIYMKIEFNHAGNGKTIPLIMWPKNDNGEFCALTTENFIDAIYIPVKLAYINGKYVYSIIGAENVNNEITLVLYEPKLDMIADVEIVQEDGND